MKRKFRKYFNEKIDEIENSFIELQKREQTSNTAELIKSTRELIELSYTYCMIFSIESGRKNKLVYARINHIFNDLKDFETKLKKKV